MTTAKPKIAPVEGHFLIPSGWDTLIALPMSLASAVLPHIRIINREYKDGAYHFSLDDKKRKELDIKLLTSEEMTALIVAERMTREE